MQEDYDNDEEEHYMLQFQQNTEQVAKNFALGIRRPDRVAGVIFEIMPVESQFYTSEYY